MSMAESPLLALIGTRLYSRPTWLYRSKQTQISTTRVLLLLLLLEQSFT
jgi:hypothetical protein